MAEKTKITMRVSIAGSIPGDRNFSAQPGDVIEVDASTAKKWIRSGSAVAADKNAPLRSTSDLLFDLSIEEARCRPCSSCERRPVATVIANKALCVACAKAHWEAGR